MEEGSTVEGAQEAVAVTAEELGALREALLRAYPETVPELVGGGSVAALLASVEPAAAAYRRVVEAVGAGNAPPPNGHPAPNAGGLSAGALNVPYVPAGSAPPVAVDVEGMPAVEKIRRGLARRGR